ncbi:hypothetical protein ACGFZ4_43785, partial [Streptomyces adustus]
MEPSSSGSRCAPWSRSFAAKHRERMLGLELQREAEQRQHEDRQRERADRRHTVELVTGAVIAPAMLGAGVYVAPENGWLSALLCGPSLLALAKVFVLRQSGPEDMRAVSPAGRIATNAAVQAQQRRRVTSARVVYRRPLGDLVLRLCGEFGGQGGVVG